MSDIMQSKSGFTDNNTAELTRDDLAAADKLKSAYKSLCQQLGRVIVGQESVIEELLIALFSRGHCILEGRPRPRQDVDDQLAVEVLVARL